MDHTLALIGRIHQGDKEARDTLFSENMGLVYSVARRFLGRGVEMEDLFQIGSIGLLKAVDHFNPEFDVKFSTYAVPMIIGEIKRFLRDDGILKVSRSIKENQYKICKMREELEKKLGREPDLRELSDAMNMPMEELAMTLESAAEVDSIYKTVYQGDGTDLQLVDRLPEKEDRHEKLLNRIFLEEILEKLEGEEKRLIVFRYFQDMTQTEVAKKMGMSQVQISRMEKRILKKLREISHKLGCTFCREPISNTLWKRREKQSIFSYFPEHYWVLEFNLFSFQTPLSELCRSSEKQVRRGVKGCLN